VNHPCYQHGYFFTFSPEHQSNKQLPFYQLLIRTKGAIMNHLVTTIISYSNETCPQSRMFNAQVDLVGGVMEASLRKQLANLNYIPGHITVKV
jgi:hypothetical protein